MHFTLITFLRINTIVYHTDGPFLASFSMALNNMRVQLVIKRVHHKANQLKGGGANQFISIYNSLSHMPGKGPSKNSSKDKFNKFQNGLTQIGSAL